MQTQYPNNSCTFEAGGISGRFSRCRIKLPAPLDYYQKDITVETNREAVLILQSLEIGCHLVSLCFRDLEGSSSKSRLSKQRQRVFMGRPAMFPMSCASLERPSWMKVPRDHSPEQSSKMLAIKDERTRYYRNLMKDIVAPLAVPFIHLTKERGRTNVPGTIIKMCAERVRQDTFFAAETLLKAVETGEISSTLIERVSAEIRQTAEKVQNSLEISRLLAGELVSGPAIGASQFI